MQMNAANFRTPCQSRPAATGNAAFASAFATGNATASATATAGNATATARAGHCDHVQLSHPQERGGNCPVNFGSWGEPSAGGTQASQPTAGTGSSGSSTDQTRDLLALALALLLKNQGQNQSQPQPGGDDASKVGEAQKADKKKDKKKPKPGHKA